MEVLSSIYDYNLIKYIMNNMWIEEIRLLNKLNNYYIFTIYLSVYIVRFTSILKINIDIIIFIVHLIVSKFI